MNVIRYSAWKLLAFAFVMAVPAGFFMWMLVAPETFLSFHGRYGFLVRFIADNFWASGSLFALTGGVTLLALEIAFGDRTALALGAGGVEVRTMFRRHRLRWTDVAGIGIVQFRRGRKGGESLIVRVHCDTGEKVLRIGVGLLEQSLTEIDRVLETAGRLAAHAPAMKHDAASARHLAGRQSGLGAPPPARGGFGRKGI